MKNMLIYDILYKAFMGVKPLHIWFEKIDGFIKIYDGIRYLVWFNDMIQFVIGLDIL